MRTLKEAAIYVGTYAKYNNGSIYGKWLILSDYSSYDEFMAACRELHSDEEDPEFMFQDWENIPDALISESYLKPFIFELMEDMNDLSDDEQEAFDAYMQLGFTEWNRTDIIENFRERYQGEYQSDADFAYYMAEMRWPKEMESEFGQYFDCEMYGRTLMTSGYTEFNGFYFYSA